MKETPITAILNLGPVMAAQFEGCEIYSKEQIIELGADEAYSVLLRSGIRPHFTAYCALVMGLEGRAWNDCKGLEKRALRKKFDAIAHAF